MVRKIVTVEEPDDGGFSARLSDYPDSFISCRDYGHNWGPSTARRERDGTISRTLVCRVCEASRNQSLDRLGYVISNSYSYEAGYVIGGIGRLSPAHRAQLRLVSIDRGE